MPQPIAETGVSTIEPGDAQSFSAQMSVAVHNEGYLDYFGFKSNPFPVVPDAEIFFVTPALDVLITSILHCIHTRKGFMVITGEVGLGKTTLSRRLLRTLEPEGVVSALVVNTHYQGDDLLKVINRDFAAPIGDKADLNHLEIMNNFLIGNYRHGKNSILIIDDAQNLTIESLEMIRMISNMETESVKLVQILLVGQSELLDKLNSHSLRQLKSRIVLHVEVLPYTRQEMEQYVHFKLNAVGGAGRISMTPSAFKLLHQFTSGCPRLINSLMDRCLYGLVAFGITRITPNMVREVASEVGLKKSATRWKGVYEPVWSSLGWVLLGLGLLLLVVGGGFLVVHLGWWPMAGDRTESRAEAETGEVRLAQNLTKGDQTKIAAAMTDHIEPSRTNRDSPTERQQTANVSAAQKQAEAEILRARKEAQEAQKSLEKALMAQTAGKKAQEDANRLAEAVRDRFIQAEAEAKRRLAEIQQVHEELNKTKEMLFKAKEALSQSQVAVASQEPQESKARLDRETTALTTGNSRLAEQAANGVSTPVGPVPEPITRFLGHYGLLNLAESFYKALQENRMAAIGEQIATKSEYRLVILGGLPEWAKSFDRIMVHTVAGSRHHILLWRSRTLPAEMLFGFASEETKQLQRFLAENKLYSAPVDGIVGRHTIAGLVAFQHKNGLPQTLKLDTTMQFYLYHTTVPTRWVIEIAVDHSEPINKLLSRIKPLNLPFFSTEIGDWRDKVWSEKVWVGPFATEAEARSVVQRKLSNSFLVDAILPVRMEQ